MIAAVQARWNRWLTRRLPASSRVRLTQRRIFIVPSKVGVMFLLALTLMLLAAINYQNSLAYALTFLLGSVFIVAILHTYRNLSGLVLRAAGANTVFVGEHVRYQVTLESLNHAHQAISLGFADEPPLIVDVPPQASTPAELSLLTTRRGWLKAPRMRVESGFPLGLLKAWSWVDLDQKALVYPQPIAADLPPVMASVGDEDEQGLRVSADGADDFQGLRSYQAGDSRKRLHWKAYSRGMGLLVKDFASLGGSQTCLDIAALSGDQEYRLSVLCYWVLQYTERQQPFSLCLDDKQIAADTGDVHCQACLRALALTGLGQ
ncbi:MAG: DUF58 domain-containing protein [Pseudomonas marincola]|uniref:DUF58 domain-containing protein n=1 Tax=Pseudomonas marincola TaxID=437900 RepID=UPI0030017BEE